MMFEESPGDQMFSGSSERREVWELEDDAIAEARDIVVQIIELMRLAGQEAPWVVTLFHIASSKLGLPYEGGGIPVEMVGDFCVLVEKVFDGRFQIKDAIESQGKYRVAVRPMEGHGEVISTGIACEHGVEKPVVMSRRKRIGFYATVRT